MAFRTVAFPLFSGGALLLGYAAFSWLGSKPRHARAPALTNRQEVEPLSDSLEHVPEELALDVSHDPPFVATASVHSSGLGALFLGRATSAFSPFHAHPARGQVAR
jgi:hypothetical protein